MLVVAALAGVVIVGLFVTMDRREGRAHALVLAAIEQHTTPDLDALIALVEQQNQRIQAPQIAVAQHASASVPLDVPQHVGTEDDDEFWKTKEQLADEEFERELSSVST